MSFPHDHNQGTVSLLTAPDGKATVAKTKKVKDPNAPKRPPTAFFLFSKQFREQNADSIKGKKASHVAKMAGAAWSLIKDTDAATPFRTRPPSPTEPPPPPPAPAPATGLVKEVDVDTQQRAGWCKAQLKQCQVLVNEDGIVQGPSNTIQSLKKLLIKGKTCKDSVSEVKVILGTYDRSPSTYDSGCKAINAILVAISKCDSSIARQGGRRKATRKRKRKSNSRTKRRMKR
jgi:hypothetical protein